MEVSDNSRDDAYEFFRALKEHLNRQLYKPRRLRELIEELAERDRRQRGNINKQREFVFLRDFIAPLMHEFLITNAGLDKREAAKAFLHESHDSLRHLTSGSPKRRPPHPFTKALGSSVDEIAATWWSKSRTPSLARSYPDMALRSPSPVTVIIEGKYFVAKSDETAVKTLVKDIYQAFFYRGLSHLAETGTHAAWDYDFACLLAYDASDNGVLLSRWDTLHKEVKRGFWEGASIYVMILRGER